MQLEAGKSQICSEPASWRPREQLMLQFKSEDHQAGEILLAQGGIHFFYSIQAFNLLGKTHPHYGGAICFTQSPLI